MSDELTVLKLERLPDRSDRRRWEADVMTDDDGPLSIEVYVTGTAAIRIPTDNWDRWVHGEVEALGQSHDATELYALSPIALHPPPES